MHSRIGPLDSSPRAWREALGISLVLLVAMVTVLSPLPAGARGTTGRMSPSFQGGLTPPSPPRVRLVANPTQIVLGNQTVISGSISGGTPWFNFTWTALPTGCTSVNASSLNCTPSEAGTFTITLVVRDSLNKTGTNTTQIVVDTTGGPTAGGGSTSSPALFLFAGVMGTVAAVATAAVLALILRRRRRKSPPVMLPPRPYVPPQEYEQP